MIALVLVLGLADPHADCVGTPAEPLCRERKQAHDRGDFEHVERLIPREVAAVREQLPPGPPKLGALRPMCLPLEAGFNVCNERRQDQRCAERYLLAYVGEGCLADPAQRPRYDNMWAMYWHRGLDDRKALEHLHAARALAWPLWVGDWDGPVGQRALVSIVVGLALQAEIAATLRDADTVREALFSIGLLRGALDDPGHAGVVADVSNELAWSLLLAHEGGVSIEDPSPLLLDALATFEHVRPDRAKADNVRINLALAALHHGTLDDARRWADEVEVAKLGDEGRMWLRVVQIRTALARGEPRDTSAWQNDLNAIASRGRVRTASWFAAWARGLRSEGMGLHDAAVAAYEAAESCLEDMTRRSRPGHETLEDRLLLTFSDPARRLVRMLVVSGEFERAEWVARRARSRALRAASRGTCAESAFVPMTRPGPGVVRLLYFPISPLQAEPLWAAFAVTSDDIRVEVVGLEPASGDTARDRALERWSEALLVPFSGEIAAAERVEVLPVDALHAVPFHALPFEGELLIDHAPVSYGLDLDTCGEAMADRAGSTLIAAGDEPQLEVEAEEVARLLLDRAAVVRPRSGRELQGLWTGSHTTLHLAAHGERPSAGERFLADDRLRFMEGIWLTRDAILQAPQTPPLVFLSACQASFTDDETLGGGVGLAHAFLLRGSRFVVGPIDDINGSVAQAFAVRFYRALADAPGDVPSAWRAAYRSTRATIAPSLEPHLRMLRLHAR